MNGDRPLPWPPLNQGRWPTREHGPICPQCQAKPPLTKATADHAVIQSMGLFEAYECPSGLGWHLRVTKDSSQD